MMNKILLFLCSAAFFVGTASATIIFQDDFSSGTAADAGYYRFGTTNTTLGVAGGDLDFAQTSDALARSGTYKTFTSQDLAVGETLIFSFNVTAMNVPSQVNHILRWGIGTTPASSDDLASSTPFESGTRQMFQFALSGSTTPGFGQFVAGSSSPIHHENGTNTQMTGFSGPDSIAANATGSVSLSITRTDTNNYSISQSAFGTDSTGTLTGVGYNFFNTIAFGVNTTGDASFSIDDVSVSVIPEPSTLALFGIALLSALAFKRRKA